MLRWSDSPEEGGLGDNAGHKQPTSPPTPQVVTSSGFRSIRSSARKEPLGESRQRRGGRAQQDSHWEQEGQAPAPADRGTRALGDCHAGSTGPGGWEGARRAETRHRGTLSRPP